MLAIGSSTARPAREDASITLSMLALPSVQPGLSAVVANFERVYPNITVNVTYSPSLAGGLEVSELAAGSGPDLLTTFPGCGTAVSVCVLARAGDLAPLVDVPWAKRSLPLVTSLSKRGPTLYTFEPDVSAYGIFINGALFAKLGLGVPQTFSQLLHICQKAKAAGTAAVVLDPGVLDLALLLTDLAVPTVYSPDPHWNSELNAGIVTFDGSGGWHQALQRLVDMNGVGCFQPGVTGFSTQSAEAAFASGQGLIFPTLSGFGGAIQADNPQFTDSFHPFPGGTEPGETTTYLNLSPSIAVNAHSSPQNQAAAITFIDFIARPKQDAVYASAKGSLTQYEFLKDEFPSNMSTLAAVFKDHEYVPNPEQRWWNAAVLGVLEEDGIGLITAQTSIDDVLNAMDAAWKQGPS